MNVHRLGLSLLLLSNLVAATLSAQPDDTLHALRALPNFETEPVSPTDVKTHLDTLGFWLWSATSAPKRFPADRPLPTSLEATTGALEIRIGDGHAPLPDGLTLLAAPVAMWDEVAEATIPSWPVPKDGRLRLPHPPGEPWRLRLLGRGIGTAWVDVAAGRGQASLSPRKTLDRQLTLRDPSGEPLPAVALRLLGAGKTGGLRAAYRGDAEGRLHLPSLPPDLAIELLIVDPRFAPLSFAGQLSSLPDTLRLTPGATLEGRTVDGEGRAVAGAEVSTISFLSAGAPRVVARGAKSDDKGAWRLTGLPLGEAQLTIKADGYARLTKILSLETLAGQNLGALTLGRGWNVELRITDPEGRSLTGAEAVTARDRRARTTDAGTLLITDLALDAAETVTVSADGFLPATIEVSGPRERALEVALSPAFRVVGRLVSRHGAPIVGGRTTLQTGTRSSFGDVEPDGRFEVDLPPATLAVLVLSSQQTTELHVTLPPGEPGEVRDLGDLEAPPSLMVTGRLVGLDEGLPIADARIWAVRSPDQELYGFARGDVLEAQSDAAGRFTLAGLATANALLRIDAAGHARRHLEIAIPEAEPELDVGTVELARGCGVTVRLDDSDPRGLLARLDLRGSWLETDMLTTSVVGDTASFSNVPAGRATLSVMRGHELACDRELEIPAGQETLEVDCQVGRSRVRGQVLMGEVAVGPGQLTWSLAGQRADGVIMHSLVGGMTKSEIFWGGRPPVQVAVDASGYFETAALRAGSWSVAWASEDGRSVATELEVSLTEAEEQELVLRLPLHAIAGRVLDAEGHGVAGARVRELAQGGFAISDETGGFRLEGLEAGTLRLQARLAEASSEVLEIELVAGVAPPTALLEIVERDDRLSLAVFDDEGTPAAGAFVFLETEDEPLRLLTADLGGRLEVPLHPPLPSRVRAAAVSKGRWVLGGWIDLETAREGIALELGAVGGIELSCEETCGVLALSSATGWDLAALTLRLGRRLALAAGEPITLAGLPPGRYLAGLAEQPMSFEIEAGEVGRLRLP